MKNLLIETEQLKNENKLFREILKKLKLPANFLFTGCDVVESEHRMASDENYALRYILKRHGVKIMCSSNEVSVIMSKNKK